MQAPIALTRWLAAISLLSVAPAATGAAAATFADSFAGGSTELDWQSFPMFGGSALQATSSKDAPDGDGGIGVLRHDGGGLATVSYADTPKAEDGFDVAAWIECPYEAGGRDGTLTGLAFYLQTARGGGDPEEGGFYRLVCDYRLGSGSFSLAYLGANIGRQPLELERWPLVEQVAPTGGGWRQVEVKVDQGLIELFWTASS
jgi:hypothetical protein